MLKLQTRVEISKSLWWRHLYSPKLWFKTQHKLFTAVVWSVRGGATVLGGSHLVITLFLYFNASHADIFIFSRTHAWLIVTRKLTHAEPLSSHLTHLSHITHIVDISLKFAFISSYSSSFSSLSFSFWAAVPSSLIWGLRCLIWGPKGLRSWLWGLEARFWV